MLRGLSGPLIVYANHSSWWDPMVSVLLAETLLPGRKHYAPMDAAALKRYPILRKIGIFPVEMATARGAAQFLRTSRGDSCERRRAVDYAAGPICGCAGGPLAFKPGLGALAARVPGRALLPLAIEYTFWDERLPETLLRFGEAGAVGDGMSTEAASERVGERAGGDDGGLEEAAMARDAARFACCCGAARDRRDLCAGAAAAGVVPRQAGAAGPHGASRVRRCADENA